MSTPSSGHVRKVVEQRAAAVKDALRGSVGDAERPTAIQRSRARRTLRREVRTQQEGLSRAWMFTGRRDRLLGGLAGIAVAAAAAAIILLGGGQRPVSATGFSPSLAPTVSPTPTASVSPEPSASPEAGPGRDTKREPYPGTALGRSAFGISDSGTGTGGGSGGTSGTGGGTGGSSTQPSPTQTQPSPTQTEPSPTQTEPSPTQTEPSPTDDHPTPSHPEILPLILHVILP
jgi:hypothetical protein